MTIRRIDPTRVPSAAEPTSGPGGGVAEGGGVGPFEDLLKEAEARQVRFSKHAQERLERRDIPLSTDDLSLLSEGIRRAEEKGSRESLLLMDHTAFVVNVASRTVITAVDEEGMKEKTFTNIDSAILLTKKG